MPTFPSAARVVSVFGIAVLLIVRASSARGTWLKV